MFKNLEIDLDQTPYFLQSELWELANVNPSKQKLFVKMKPISISKKWSENENVKDGVTILLMGEADPVKEENQDGDKKDEESNNV